jgi:hypothetical protein
MLSKYDAVEVQGTIELGDGVIEVCHDSDTPTMYSVYGHKPEGGVEWLSDHRSRESALMTARMISENEGIPMYSYCKP